VSYPNLPIFYVGTYNFFELASTTNYNFNFTFYDFTVSNLQQSTILHITIYNIVQLYRLQCYHLQCYTLLAQPQQGCQMVYFQTKNPNLGKYLWALDWKMLIHTYVQNVFDI
jgi:hypothetical protein